MEKALDGGLIDSKSQSPRGFHSIYQRGRKLDTAFHTHNANSSQNQQLVLLSLSDSPTAFENRPTSKSSFLGHRMATAQCSRASCPQSRVGFDIYLDWQLALPRRLLSLTDFSEEIHRLLPLCEN
jgi:hypothetical protein